MRKTSRLFFAGLATVLLTASIATASRDDRKTELTVNESIEIPGHVLEPGEYTMEIVDNGTSNHIVAFRDNQDNLITTTMAVSAERTQAEGTKFTFYDMPMDQPPAMRTWFYPGETIGLEFVYPESRGKIISAYAHRNVPSMSDAEFEKAFKKAHDPQLVAVKQVKIYGLAPEGKQMEMAKAREANARADRRTWDSSMYMETREVEESRLERQIRKEIATLPFYSIWDNINFSVSNDGNVTVNGKVLRPSLKKSIERAVKTVEGVKAVDNQVDILPTSPRDDDIRRAAYRSIYGHTALQRYQMRAVPPIHIIVENGRLTLEGVVSSPLDKNVAGAQANGVNGVLEVQNNLRVEG